MKVALFVPCYVDQFYPQVGIATLQLLEKLDVEVDVPPAQTCCGQPMANAGFSDLSNGCHRHFLNVFASYQTIVSPSGSCVLHLREHLSEIHHDSSDEPPRILELCEFLTDIVDVKSLNAKFPYKVGFHNSCHAQRGLNLSQMSELVAPDFSKPRRLLNMVEGINLISLQRPDECCGFGGTFCVSEEAVSVRMGEDRIADHINNDAAFITGTDMSCLMHLDGLLRRQGSGTRVIHLAEILNNESDYVINPKK